METCNVSTIRVKPRLGMPLTFIATASPELAGIAGTVTHVWPRFRSGDYLVTLEYAQPVRLCNQFIRHIDAFLSELEPPARPISDGLSSEESGSQHGLVGIKFLRS